MKILTKKLINKSIEVQKVWKLLREDIINQMKELSMRQEILTRHIYIRDILDKAMVLYWKGKEKITNMLIRIYQHSKSNIVNGIRDIILSKELEKSWRKIWRDMDLLVLYELYANMIKELNLE